MPLIKIQTKYFENIKQMLWQAYTLHKLPIHTLIIHFGNGELLKLILNTIYHIIGILLPLIKTTCAT